MVHYTKKPDNVIEINESQALDHPGELIRETVGETRDRNEMLSFIGNQGGWVNVIILLMIRDAAHKPGVSCAGGRFVDGCSASVGVVKRTPPHNLVLLLWRSCKVII